MNLRTLQPGDKILTRDGAQAEVLTETEDGEWIKVRYLEAKDDPSLEGMEDFVNEDEIEETDQGC
jgi:hypothetical protein